MNNDAFQHNLRSRGKLTNQPKPTTVPKKKTKKANCSKKSVTVNEKKADNISQQEIMPEQNFVV